MKCHKCGGRHAACWCSQTQCTLCGKKGHANYLCEYVKPGPAFDPKQPFQSKGSLKGGGQDKRKRKQRFEDQRLVIVHAESLSEMQSGRFTFSISKMTNRLQWSPGEYIMMPSIGMVDQKLCLAFKYRGNTKFQMIKLAHVNFEWICDNNHNVADHLNASWSRVSSNVETDQDLLYLNNQLQRPCEVENLEKYLNDGLENYGNTCFVAVLCQGLAALVPAYAEAFNVAMEGEPHSVTSKFLKVITVLGSALKERSTVSRTSWIS